MINFCPIEKKTLNGAKKLSLGHGSKIDSVLYFAALQKNNRHGA